MGKMESNGTLRNSQGTYKGQVLPDGTVRDRSGAYKGKFEGGVKQQYAADVLFFSLLF